MTVIATCGEHAVKRIDELREFSKMRTEFFFAALEFNSSEIDRPTIVNPHDDTLSVNPHIVGDDLNPLRNTDTITIVCFRVVGFFHLLYCTLIEANKPYSLFFHQCDS